MVKLFIIVLAIAQCAGKQLTEQPFAHDSPVVEAVVNLIRESCILPKDNLLLRRLAYVESQDGTLPKTFRVGYFGGIWQVDEDMFLKTQRASSILTPLHSKIQQTFNRDWSMVTWHELVKPLYSGLAAALYISDTTGGIVPQNTEEQGRYWELNYRDGTSAYNYTTIVNLMNKGCVGNEAIDLMFLVDSSSSLSKDDFTRAKEFVSNVVKKFTIGPSRTRLAFIRYSSKAEQLIGFTTSVQSLSSILTSIQNIPYESGNTATAVALDMARKTFMSSSSSQAVKVTVLITDGQSDDKIDTQHAVDNLKDEGVVVFSIGVGNLIEQNELEYLATAPSCTHSFTVKNYQAINFLVEEIEHSVCRAPLYANETVTCQIGYCPPYAFPITLKGLTITANITCGVTSMYTSTSQQYPSEASYDKHANIIQGNLTELFTAGVNTNQFLYLKVDNKMSDGRFHPGGCWVTLTPFHGQISHTVHIYCEENGVKRPCTQAELCPDGHVSGYNPCTKENMVNGKSKFEFPGDNTKFYLCDLIGQPYVVNCPDGQVFSPSCQSCYGNNGGTISNCNNYNGNFDNMCSTENIQAGKLYFTHPTNISLYIQCDLWGHAYVKSCLGIGSNFIWQETKLSCEPRDTLINPCPHMSVDGQRFYAYPPNQAKFIQCSDALDPLVLNCPLGLIWNDCIKTCAYRSTVGDNCHIDPNGPLASYIHSM